MAFTGKQSFVLAGEESTFNTAVSTTKDLGIITSVDTTLNNNTQAIDGIGARQAIDLVSGSFDGTISFSGTLNSGAPIEMFFGNSTDTASTSDYTHTFVTGATVQSDINSYTISSNHDSSDDVVVTYSGCKSNSFTINMEVGGILTYDTEFILSSVDTTESLGTKIITTTTPLIAANASVSTGDDGSESIKCPISTFSAAFNNNIDANDVRCIGNRQAVDLIVKKLEMTGDFSAKFSTVIEADRFLGGSSPIDGTPTDTTIVFQANNGVTLGSGRVEFYVKLTGCQYESLGRSYSQDGMVEESFSYIAEKVNTIYFVDQTATYF